MFSLGNLTSSLGNETSEESMVYQLAASTSQHQHHPQQQQQLPKAPITDLVNWKDVPDKYLLIVANFLVGRINDSSVIDQLNGPILKSSVDSTYWIFLIQYAALSMLGIVMNIAIICYIMYHRLYRDVTNAFIVNLALCHFIQCSVVLPLTLMVMIIQNWIFGQFLCFFLPMLQDIPLHVALISHILIAWDRMRWLRDPMRGRFPAFVCCCATWLTGMVIALPYPIYMMYVEIGDFVPSLSGIGLCVVNLMDDMHEYMRGLFVIMYCGPTVFMAYLYVKTSQELRPPEGPLAVMMFEHRAGVRNRQKRTSSTSSGDRSLSGTTGAGPNGTQSTTSGIGTITTHTSSSNACTVTKSLPKSLTRSYDLYNAELDVNREKRKQRNFGSMAAAQVLCLCPLMVLRFARLSMEETYENQKHIDFTYLMFVWIAFLPTVIFPCIYASQILPRSEQERLRGYFRLSSKRLKISRSVGADMAADARTYGHNKHTGRKGSTDKDDSTLNGCTMPTSIISSGGGGGGDGDGDDSLSVPLHGMNAKVGRHDLKSTSATSKYHQRQTGKSLANGKHYTPHGSGGGGGRNGTTNNSLKMNDIKINVISDERTKGNADTPCRAPPRCARKASGGSCSNNGSIASGHPHSHRKLTLDSLDMSSSNITASTYCIGNGNGNGHSFMDDGGTSNFGDGEESSIAGGVKKWPGGRLQDSVSDCDTMSRLDSSSTLARDLEMMDLLERERSLHLHDMIERDRHGDPMRSVPGERRRLPDLEKIYQLSPKIIGKHEVYNFDGSTTASTSASTLTGHDSHTLSTSVPSDYDPLQGVTRHDAYSAASTLPEEQLKRNSYGHAKSLDDEEVPSDFYDNYVPGGKEPLPSAGNATPAATPPVYQYQYSRRLSRNSSHQSQGSGSHHRNSKRDSFNSLNGTDLIAGAFGELDPTQPLTKMSVIESRMRRSSGRTSSFSSSGRSSMKSRDYNHGSSSHSAHPELDFRENIFAEL